MEHTTSHSQNCSRLSGKLPCSFLYLIINRGQKTTSRRPRSSERNDAAVVYAGMTSRPLKFRLAEHNDPNSGGYTAGKGPWHLLDCKAYLSSDCARLAERKLKHSKYDKRNWIKRTGRLRKLCHRHGIQYPSLT